MTVNLLRTSRINPNLSAHEQMEGTFNYNKTPLSPLQINVLSYEMPSHRSSWDEHGKEGWYIWPEPEHCQCYKVLIKKTLAIRTPLSVKFFPERIKMPSNSSTDRIIKTVKQLTHAIKNLSPPNPFEHVGNKDVRSFKQLAEIFQRQSMEIKQKETKSKSSQRVKTPDSKLQKVEETKVVPQEPEKLNTPNTKLQRVEESKYSPCGETLTIFYG